MSIKRTTTYTCDSCGLSNDLDGTITSTPVGWGCLAINRLYADPAWDADGWERYLICGECRNALQDQCGNIRELLALEPEPAVAS